ncbi:MAG: pitrilysin family protein [Candidatus Aenigmatarchaeota archaeon]
MNLKKEILDNGIILYKLRIPNTNTIAVSINVNIGSVYEEEDKRGISHLLEHMMFKSNKKYSAKEVSMGLELNGGISNAFTSNFLTSYFVEVIPKGFERILDILHSMFINENYKKDEFEREKKVVLSEIERYENNPEDMLERLIPKSIFGNSDYGSPISGYRETVSSISKEELEEFKLKYYCSKNTFILIEGNFSDKHLELIRKKFSKIEESSAKKKKPSKSKGSDIIKRMNTKNQIYYSKNFEIEFNKNNFFMPFIFSKVISGGISSLMFDVFREKYGIGYRVYFEPTYIYEDRIILTLGIPGYEKEREKNVNAAYEYLIEQILDRKNFQKYLNGRKKVISLEYEKIKGDLFKRILREVFIVSINEKTIDDFYSKAITIKTEEIIKFLKYLEESKIVKIIPL